MNSNPRQSRPSAAKLPLSGAAAPLRRSRPVGRSHGAEPLQSTSYHPFGTERSNVGSGSRTSYIGREHDNETDLGFYGVRLYEPEYGRFLSTDVLWGKYLPLQPYQYAGNNPVMALDAGGDSVRFLSERAERQYNEAHAHIVSKHPAAAGVFEAVESSDDLVYIQTNSRGENRFIEDEAAGMMSNSERTFHTVHWDPTASIDYGSEGAVSPALILFHEIQHAHGVVTGTSASTANDGSKTTSPEEARVIQQENNAARSLKEGIRTFHDYIQARKVHGPGYGQIKRVKSP